MSSSWKGGKGKGAKGGKGGYWGYSQDEYTPRLDPTRKGDRFATTPLVGYTVVHGNWQDGKGNGSKSGGKAGGKGGKGAKGGKGGKGMKGGYSYWNSQSEPTQTYHESWNSSSLSGWAPSQSGANSFITYVPRSEQVQVVRESLIQPTGSSNESSANNEVLAVALLSTSLSLPLYLYLYLSLSRDILDKLSSALVTTGDTSHRAA